MTAVTTTLLSAAATTPITIVRPILTALAPARLPLLLVLCDQKEQDGRINVSHLIVDGTQLADEVFDGHGHGVEVRKHLNGARHESSTRCACPPSRRLAPSGCRPASLSNRIERSSIVLTVNVHEVLELLQEALRVSVLHAIIV